MILRILRQAVGWRTLAVMGGLGLATAALVGTVLASSPVLVTGDASGTIPSGEYAGQPFTVHVSGEYESFGYGTLTTGAGTVVQIGSERFEGIVSPGYGVYDSLCCGSGDVFADWFVMYGQWRHVTAPVPHNHLAAVGGASNILGVYDTQVCFTIADQTGTIVDPGPGQAHDPGIDPVCVYEGSTLTITAGPPREVVIDIKPGDSENAIDPKAHGVIPVAILSTDTFDATTVDPLTVKFGMGLAVEIHGRGHFNDVNADGRIDLVLHFATEATGIYEGLSSVPLTGKTFDGTPIVGSDAIVVVPQ